MTGPMIPPGSFVKTPPSAGGPKRHRIPTFDVLRTLPGATEWSFWCIQVHTAIATFAPLNNVTPSIPSFVNIPSGFEGLVTWITIGPNIIPSSGGLGTWFPGLTFNQVAVPGWYPMAAGNATDGMGNWWMTTEIPVPSQTTINLVKLGDTLGAGNPADIGGQVHGWQWPIRSRLEWEKSQGLA